VQLYYQIGLLGQRDLPFAPDPRTGFEMVLLRMLAFRPDGLDGPESASSSNSGYSAPDKKHQRTMSSTQAAVVPSQREDSIKHKAKLSVTAPAKLVVVDAVPVAQPRPAQGQRTDDWHQVTAAIAPDLGGMATQLAEHCVIKGWDGNRLILSLASTKLVSDKTKARLQEALGRYYGAEIDLQFEQLGTAASDRAQSPAERKAQERKERQHLAETALTQNPYVQGLIQSFQAELVPGSIQPGHP
jgi:DNA polymerase-3 subunit gamma/tau